MNWGLPTSVEIGGESYEIRTDFRVILDIFVMLSDPDLSGTDRAEGILAMFYVAPESIPPQHLQEAVDRFTWFQNGGQEQQNGKKQPRLVDWERDYPLIVPPINRIFGRDIREVPYDTDTEAFLKCIRDELPYRPTTGFRYEVLTDDPSVRKQVDDMIFDFYGEENPRQLEEYQKTPDQGMTMGGIK